MILTIKKGASQKELKEIEKKIHRNTTSNVGFDAKKYNGTVKFDDVALTIQKQLRNEWERNIG